MGEHVIEVGPAVYRCQFGGPARSVLLRPIETLCEMDDIRAELDREKKARKAGDPPEKPFEYVRRFAAWLKAQPECPQDLTLSEAYEIWVEIEAEHLRGNARRRELLSSLGFTGPPPSDSRPGPSSDSTDAFDD